MASTKANSIDGLVISFVNEQNRPLNAQQIADILQKSGVKKTGAQKALEASAAAGEIICKDYGKQKIFLAKQSQFTIPSNADLEAMRKENEQLLEEGKAERTAYLKIEAELKGVQSSLTKDQIEAGITRLTGQNKTLESKLSVIRGGKNLMTEGDKSTIEHQYAQQSTLWKKRKRVFKDLWSHLEEHIQKSAAEFREEIGIEMDEDVGVDPEQHWNLSTKKTRF